jgi:hypothetical protein
MENQWHFVQIVDRKQGEQNFVQIVVLHKVAPMQEDQVLHNKCTSQHVTSMMVESAYYFAVV